MINKFNKYYYSLKSLIHHATGAEQRFLYDFFNLYWAESNIRLRILQWCARVRGGSYHHFNQIIFLRPNLTNMFLKNRAV